MDLHDAEAACSLREGKVSCWSRPEAASIWKGVGGTSQKKGRARGALGWLPSTLSSPELVTEGHAWSPEFKHVMPPSRGCLLGLIHEWLWQTERTVGDGNAYSLSKKL